MPDTDVKINTSVTTDGIAQPQADSTKDTDEKGAHWIGLLFGGVLLVVTGGLVGGALLLDRKTNSVPLAAMLIVAAFTFVAAFAVPVIVYALQRARSRREQWFEKEYKTLEKFAKTGNNSPLGDLIAFNFRLMERFVGVAITQAQASYLACTVAATAGLVVLIVGATTVLTVDGLASQITVGALTTVGAAVGSYVSVTFLNTFKMTSRQMSYYYGQPLVHCYLLHAEWLGNRFVRDASAEHRWQIHHELIQAAIDASQNAQNHLLDLQLEGERATTSAKAAHS